MQLRLPVAGLALAMFATAATPPAEAASILANFSGTVSNQIGTTYNVGNLISGSFDYDTSTGRYDSFDIAGYGLPSGSFSSYAPPPLQKTSSAIFEANQSPSGNGSSGYTDLSVNLEAPFTNNEFNTTDLVAFVTNPGTYITDPTDPGVSTISYISRDANSNVLTQLNANLTSFSATAVPEPSGLTPLAAGAVALLIWHRRRG
ncbi:MAG: hypothetical protein JOZ78_23470 [Chroococcidiopsidaceae cyanobacterium CP_BM_ER_R8_30]|nr:hypothetical protein [Chroococcidiopsidaceae cyanobacterium CP_BM_ER_R8_30]